MKTKICTDIDQSKKLIELGIDPDTADMGYLWWINTETKKQGIDEIPTVLNGLPLEKCDIPAWSLPALLNLLPNWYIHSSNPLCSTCCCRVNDMEIYKDDPIDAAFKMICYLKESNKI